jgi:hypothetical protein
VDQGCFSERWRTTLLIPPGSRETQLCKTKAARDVTVAQNRKCKTPTTTSIYRFHGKNEVDATLRPRVDTTECKAFALVAQMISPQKEDVI